MEVTAAWAFAKALVRREFVYGQVVNPSDPQLMEGGSTCPICQVSFYNKALVPPSLRCLPDCLAPNMRGLSGVSCSRTFLALSVCSHGNPCWANHGGKRGGIGAWVQPAVTPHSWELREVWGAGSDEDSHQADMQPFLLRRLHQHLAGARADLPHVQEDRAACWHHACLRRCHSAGPSPFLSAPGVCRFTCRQRSAGESLCGADLLLQ